MRRIVIAGASLAGLRAAEGLRRRGFDGVLTIVGAEPHLPYDRPPLSKELLAGTRMPEDCALDVNDLDVDWVLGCSATGVDVASGRLLTEDGAISYDALVIATGARAREWPTHIGLDGIHTLRTLDDAIALRVAAREAERVVIVGAGFIGCEVAATLRQGGREVHVVDVASYPLTALGPEVGRRVAQLHTDNGVALHLNAAVAAFEGPKRVEAVRLQDGSRLSADLVLLALGAVPNTEWLEASGLPVRDGVLCDEYGCVRGTDAIMAAGDVARWPLLGDDIRIEHWSNAATMGLAVASNLLVPRAERRPYRPLPSIWSDQYDVRIQATGFLGRAVSYSVAQDSDPLTVLEGHRDGELVAAVAFSAPAAIARYGRLLRERLAEPPAEAA